MSALGHEQTFALQQAMSALHPIATAKADSRKRSCPLCPRARKSDIEEFILCCAGANVGPQP
jgi:hypothetical protein